MIVVGDDFYVRTANILYFPFLTNFPGGPNTEIDQDDSGRIQEGHKAETWSSKWQTDQREFRGPHDIDQQGMSC